MSFIVIDLERELQDLKDKSQIEQDVAGKRIKELQFHILKVQEETSDKE